VTWKVGGLWSLPQGVSARGTYSSAFRAPSINELFSGTSDNFASATDPCETRATPEIAANCMKRHPGIPADFDNPNTQVQGIVGGNENLHQETASSYTAGLVFEPPQIKGLSMTLDYFNIAITQAIQREGTQNILNGCYVLDVDSECAKIERDSTFLVNFVDDRNQNIGGTETSGIDLAVAYEHQQPFGKFRHILEGSWLQKYDRVFPTVTIKGAGNYDLIPAPKLKANFTTIWQRKGINAGVNVHYINAFKECEDGDCSDPNAPAHRIDMNITTDLFLGYTAKTSAGTTSLTVGVNNLTDQDPPLIYSSADANSDAATYDYKGRFFYTRLTHTF